MRSVLLLLFVTLWQLSSAQTVKVLRINPDDARGGSVSDIFDSVTYIPLETTKASLFGSISQLQVSKHYFTFYDYSTKGIFVFDKQGKFISKTTTAPGLPAENSWDLNDFVLNPFDENIYIRYNIWNPKKKIKSEQRVAVFNANGQLNRLLVVDSTLFRNISHDRFVFLDSTTALFAIETRDTTSTHYFTIIKDFKTLKQKMIPYNTQDPYIGYSKNYRCSSIGADFSAWTRIHDYDVQIMEGSQPVKYRFLLPKEISIDSSVYKDTAMMKNVLLVNDYAQTHRDKILGIPAITKSKDLIAFTLQKGQGYTKRDSYIINLLSSNLYNFGKITPDSTNGYLPIIDFSLVAADQSHLYSTVAAYALFATKKDTQQKHPQYSPAMQTFFATQDRKSNPVIVVLKPKRKL